MNKIIIESSLKNKDVNWFYDQLYKNNSDFNILNNIYYLLLNTSKDDEILILYVLYKIITENDLVNIGISPTPKKGLTFTDSNNTPLGIYHCHINSNTKMVLIWYVEKDSNGDLNIQLEYIKHPTYLDNYKSVLKNIYKNTNGYNTITNEYFKNYRSLTYLKDSFIQKWFNFIK